MSNGSRWTAAMGLTTFAAALMIISGIWAFLVGISALAKDKVFVVAPDYTYRIDVTGWGWIHLILGIVVAVGGVCLLLGQTWARILAIILAVLSAVAQFMFLPYYPLWSILIIALNVFVIWAVLTSGRERAVV
ncbi:MAG TPA: hypothetical protein VE465_12905 [Streptosporangiaceae bacterium]|jgi:hypothetical protein|nr:hypothetical protein [Streptosporangiaceae bacterium]